MEKEFEPKKTFCKSFFALFILIVAMRDWMNKNNQEKPQTF
jgi:hypothetical protein